MGPNLFEIAISIRPRMRDWMFSSVVSAGLPAKAGASVIAKRHHRAFDADGLIRNAQHFGAFGGIVEAFLRGVARRHHHAAHALGSQRIDRHRRGQRRIDAARKPQHDAGKAVLVHVIAQAQHHRVIDGRRALLACPALARRADPLGRPARRHSVTTSLFLPGRQRPGDRAVGIDDQGGAVEDELVLPAHLVEIDERAGAPRSRAPRSG